MIYFKIVKPQRSQRGKPQPKRAALALKLQITKTGVPGVPSGEKIKVWPTKRVDHKE